MATAPPPAGGYQTDYGPPVPSPVPVAPAPAAIPTSNSPNASLDSNTNYVTPGTPAPGAPAADPYQALIQADPNYLAWQTNSIQTLSNAASARQAAIRALVEQFGGMPSGFTDQYGDLTSADMGLASSNPYSTEAELKRAYQGNVDAMRKALAARGALHSGDLGFNQNQLDTGYGQSQYDAGQQFASELQAAIGAYTSAQDQDRQAQQAAIAQAYADIIGNPAYVPQ